MRSRGKSKKGRGEQTRKSRVTDRKLEDQRPQPAQEPSKFSLRNVLKQTPKALMAVCFLILAGLGHYVTVDSFGTKLEITPGDPLDPTDPFTSPFQIQNDGLLPVSKIQTSCYVRNVLSDRNNQFGHAIGTTNRPPVTLDRGEKFTAFCTSPVKLTPDRITQADVELDVSYKPAWSWWTSGIVRRFSMMRKQDGGVLWTPKALTER